MKRQKPVEPRMRPDPALARGVALHEAMAEKHDLLDLTPILTDREVLKVIHRKLHESGWYRKWGYDAHARLYKALNKFFGTDDAHLR
jgi:hypothetical protein